MILEEGVQESLVVEEVGGVKRPDLADYHRRDIVETLFKDLALLVQSILLFQEGKELEVIVDIGLSLNPLNLKHPPDSIL